MALGKKTGGRKAGDKNKDTDFKAQVKADLVERFGARASVIYETYFDGKQFLNDLAELDAEKRIHWMLKLADITLKHKVASTKIAEPEEQQKPHIQMLLERLGDEIND